MKFPESQRAIYSRNPLVEVICQIRFPRILKIETETPVNFQEEVRSEYPNLQTSTVELVLEQSPQLNSPTRTFNQASAYEFIDKEGNWRLVLSSDFIAISTLRYKNWVDFRDRLLKAIQLLVKHYSPSHFTRIGLRYQDVIIRSDLGLQNRSWQSLLEPPILGVFAANNLPEQDFLEALSFFTCRLDYSNAILSVRYGLARKNDSQELGYLIDSDFYTENFTEINDAIAHLDLFNREAGNFFRWCIKEDLLQALEPKFGG